MFVRISISSFLLPLSCEQLFAFEFLRDDDAVELQTTSTGTIFHVLEDRDRISNGRARADQIGRLEFIAQFLLDVILVDIHFYLKSMHGINFLLDKKRKISRAIHRFSIVFPSIRFRNYQINNYHSHLAEVFRYSSSFISVDQGLEKSNQERWMSLRFLLKIINESRQIFIDHLSTTVHRRYLGLGLR